MRWLYTAVAISSSVGRLLCQQATMDQGSLLSPKIVRYADSTDTLLPSTLCSYYLSFMDGWDRSHDHPFLSEQVIEYPGMPEVWQKWERISSKYLFVLEAQKELSIASEFAKSCLIELEHATSVNLNRYGVKLFLEGLSTGSRFALATEQVLFFVAECVGETLADREYR